MKLLLLLHLPPLLAFYLPPSPRSLPLPPPTLLHLSPPSGPSSLTTYISTHSKLPLPPKLLLPLSTSLVPLSTLTSLLPCPPLLKLTAGTLAALASTVGRSALHEDVRKACPAAVASALLDGADIPALRREYNVDEFDFGEMCVEVYAVYLDGMAKDPTVKLAELKELAGVRDRLGLTNLMVGRGHAEAATRLYRDIVRFTSREELEEEDHPDRRSLDKLLFLSERAFRQGGETEEAFTFEFSRVAKILGDLDVAEGMERVTAVANPFYERALENTRKKLETGAVSSDMLERARNTLGISAGNAKDLHIDAFAKEVRVQLGLKEEEEEEDDGEDLDYDQNKRLSTDRDALQKLEEMKAKAEAKKTMIPDTSHIKFKDGAFDHLSKLQEILDLTDQDAEYEIQAATYDYLRNSAMIALRDATNNVISHSKAWEIIHSRQKELLFKDSSMKDLMINIIMQTLGKPIERVNVFARVNNAAATYDGLIDAIAAKQVCKEVCQKAGWQEFEDFEKICFDPNDSESACGFIGRTDRQHMYNLFFGRSIKVGENGRKSLDDDARAKLKELRGMLGISEEDGENQIKAVFGPELNNVLVSATTELLGGNVTPTLIKTLKDNVAQVISDFNLDEEMIQASSLPLYEKAVGKISETTPGGIPTKEEVEILDTLREFLNIKEEEANKIHLGYFGEAYRKGVKEALGTTGVIREEFRRPLEDLRGRLGVSEKAAKMIYIDAIGDRMEPMVRYISEETERLVLTNDQLARKRGADYGEDVFKSGQSPSGKLGLGTEGNIMGDIMNLVDFYVENDMIQREVVVTDKVEGNGEETTAVDETPLYESTYPITAIEKGWIDTKMAELCYRQFLVNTFTDQSPNAPRYESSKATFGGILGLTAAQMDSIGSSIGGTVYDNYVTQSLSTKGALDQQDMMFLANMQSKLGISEEQGERMLVDTQKKILAEEASGLLDGPEPPTPEKIKAFREKCNSLGLDLETDVGLSRARIVNMFSMEISPGIDNGDITMDSGDLIAEIQSSLGLGEEEGEEVIASIITDRAASLYVTIKSCLIRGLDFDALESIEKLIQYARFVDGELGLRIAPSDAWKAFSIFDNSDFTGVEEGKVEEEKRLLKLALGLPGDE